MRVAAPGPTRDIFDKKKLIGPPHYLTDGRFTWPGDFAYYVRNYNVRVAKGLVEYMLANSWKVPFNIDMNTLEL